MTSSVIIDRNQFLSKLWITSCRSSLNQAFAVVDRENLSLHETASTRRVCPGVFAKRHGMCINPLEAIRIREHDGEWRIDASKRHQRVRERHATGMTIHCNMIFFFLLIKKQLGRWNQPSSRRSCEQLSVRRWRVSDEAGMPSTPKCQMRFNYLLCGAKSPEPITLTRELPLRERSVLPSPGIQRRWGTPRRRAKKYIFSNTQNKSNEKSLNQIKWIQE